MSLTLKRPCPFTLTIHQYSDSHTLLTMDPDPFATRYIKDPFPEWNPLSPTTIPEDVYSENPSHQRSPSPPKRPRNAKNLSLSVPPGTKNTPNLPTSAPASPFRSPRLPSRRPSNLTINIHSLHRHPSTPELYTRDISSPIVASPATFTSQFPGLNIESTRRNEDRPKTRHTDPSLNDVSFEESVEREKAYPDGPRLILGPNIWLYAAPDLELAKSYDLVVNVAREVENPFIITDPVDPARSSPDSEDTTSSPFSTYASTVSASSPSIPSSISSALSASSPQRGLKSPESSIPISFRYNNVEYMHIPWDHNSSLSQELPGIVDHILERSDAGKKVLVHCQVYPFKYPLIVVWCIPLSNPRHRSRDEETRIRNT